MKLLVSVLVGFFLLFIVCCGLGMLFQPSETEMAERKSKRQASPPRLSTPSPEAAKYLKPQPSLELEKWLDDYLASQAAISELELAKPSAPKYEQRMWSTTVGKFTTQGTLVSTDSLNATIRKTNGKNATVSKERLIAEDRIYIEKAFAEFEAFNQVTAEWQTKLEQEQTKMAEYGRLISIDNSPLAMTPERSAIVDKLQSVHRTKLKAERQRQAEEAKAKQIAEARKKEEADAKAKLAAELEAKQVAQERLNSFASLIRAIDREGTLFADISARDTTVTVQVTNFWHVTNYQIRYQTAQNLWKAWAAIESPNKPDHARLSIVDLNGNEVGGSRILAGSLIWVQK